MFWTAILLAEFGIRSLELGYECTSHFCLVTSDNFLAPSIASPRLKHVADVHPPVRQTKAGEIAGAAQRDAKAAIAILADARQPRLQLATCATPRQLAPSNRNLRAQTA